MSGARRELLSPRALSRALLERQDLLRRVDRPATDEIEHLVGLQGQTPLSPYYALWSRLKSFRPAELAGMITKRQAVRMGLMRATIPLVTAGDALRLRPRLQQVPERVFRSQRAFVRGRASPRPGYSGARTLLARLRQRLAGPCGPEPDLTQSVRRPTGPAIREWKPGNAACGWIRSRPVADRNGG